MNIIKTIFASIEANQTNEQRAHLGASSIGDSCSRKLWYGFRWCNPPKSFDAATLLKFDDGNRTEALVASHMEAAGLHVTDQQRHAHAIEGHFGSSIDGLVELAGSKYIWENKCVDSPEKAARAGSLRAWNPIYYAQAIMYMHLFGIDRHVTTIVGPGGRAPWVTLYTDPDPVEAEALLEKARNIIYSDTPPPAISKDPAYYLCKWCPASTVCHTIALPKPSCRNCVAAVPTDAGDGAWTCVRFNRPITDFAGCDHHLYIPALLSRRGTAIDAAEDDSWIDYGTFRNGIASDPSTNTLTSAQLHATA